LVAISQKRQFFGSTFGFAGQLERQNVASDTIDAKGFTLASFAQKQRNRIGLRPSQQGDTKNAQ
jgi:hypothetical protein